MSPVLVPKTLLLRVKKKLQAGFTLLEVMIAVVILAVGLASLFTSEAGAVRIAQRARTTTIATLLARCKMAEVEEKVLKEGWPGELIEGRDECCEEGAQAGFACEWKVERIKMPDQNEDAGTEPADTKAGAGDSKSKGPGGGGMLDTLAQMSKQEPGERLSGITDFLSGGGSKLTDSEQRDEDERNAKNPLDKDRKKKGDEGGSQLDPMASMVMGLALPVLKPVIEEGVRRASVVVKWKEGQKEQTFEVVQFMVTEQQIILPDLDDDGDGGIPSAAPTTAPAAPTTTPAQTSTTSGAKR